MLLLVIVAFTFIAPAIVCGLKGKQWFMVLGIFATPLFSITGAIRLAQPDSTWYRKYYGYDKMRRSWERYQRTPFER